MIGTTHETEPERSTICNDENHSLVGTDIGLSLQAFLQIIATPDSTQFSTLQTDSRVSLRVFLPDVRERINYKFKNEFCEFVPIGWVEIEDVWYPLCYKVVTEEMKSLGLRRNPNIMTFAVGEWRALSDEDVLPGKSDWGGIWSARRKGSTTTLKKYCQKKHGMSTKVYLTALLDPVFASDYGIKSRGVMLLREDV